MWIYLFSTSKNYPDPAAEIQLLAEVSAAGHEAFLKLSAKDDAPLKRGRPGESVLLCTREEGIWAVHADARLTGPAIRGQTPDSVLSLYGDTGDLHWWRALTDVRVFDGPISPAELGAEEKSLPRSGQAYIVRVRLDSPDPLVRQDPGYGLRNGDSSAMVGLAMGDYRVVRESSEDVTTDEQGRIFRMTGERVEEPGLEPEMILRGLADQASGRMTSLQELRARRR